MGNWGRRCRRIWQGPHCRHRLCLFAMASNFILLCDLLSLLCAAAAAVAVVCPLGPGLVWVWCPGSAKGCCCLQFLGPGAEFKGSLLRGRLSCASFPPFKLRNVSLCSRYLLCQDLGHDCAFYVANTIRIGPRAGDLF